MITRTRKFGGKTYQYYLRFDFKRDAQRRAVDERSHGRLVRITPETVSEKAIPYHPNKSPYKVQYYVLWIRKSK